jgi:hypothetical protein
MTVGAGYLDVAAAVANKDVASGSAESPTAHYDSASGKVSLVFDPSSVWNRTTIDGAKGLWGMQTVWGASDVNEDSTLIGANQAAWASNSVSGFQVIWGDKGLWGMKGLWGTSDTDADKGLWGTKGLWGMKGLWGTDSSTSDSDVNFTVN